MRASFLVSVFSAQGKRAYQEDTYVADGRLYAVFDGHGGPGASRVAQQHIAEAVEGECGGGDYETCMERAFLQVEERYRLSEQPESDVGKSKRQEGREGSTACVAVVSEDASQVVVANAGDSRCVLCRGGHAIPLSEDHKPSDAHEYRRIRKNGYYAFKTPVSGCYRIYKPRQDALVGGLNLSRALGDFLYEGAVPSTPDITRTPLQAGDILVLATDGVWDTVSNAQACSIVSQVRDREEAAAILVQAALDQHSSDNCTSVVVYAQ